MIRIKVLLILLVGLIYVSCQETNNIKIDREDLTGKWRIYSATRDGSPTKSLSKGYIFFSPSFKLQSNILNTVDSLAFNMKENKIYLPDQDYHFVVKEMSSDSMVISTRINKTNYVLNMTLD